MEQTFVWLTALALIGAGLWFFVRPKVRSRVPPALRPGNRLPAFDAVDDKGAAVSESDLRGAPAVVLFVRGNWCPFCSSQVADMTSHYREIAELGARLIFLTPKPLQTTRRVAEFYEVDFDFWLDENLNVTREVGLLMENGVPKSHRDEYGSATMWPAALVLDGDGVIRYSEISKVIVDRPNSAKLLAELKKISQA